MQAIEKQKECLENVERVANISTDIRRASGWRPCRLLCRDPSLPALHQLRAQGDVRQSLLHEVVDPARILHRHLQ